MAFRFKRKESVARATRRLGHEQCDDALECLADCRQIEAIHCVRKDIKKARAMLRLTRNRIRKRDYRLLIKLLRQAANHLAAVRDAYVKSAALRDLLAHFKSQLAPQALRHVRTTLQTDLRKEKERFIERNTAEAVQRLIRRAARQFDDLNISGKGWPALCPGVKVAYRQGREAYQTVLEHPAPENFHEWRKRVKDLWYDVRVLRPVWPEQMDAMAAELGTLGEHLGDDHDLFILQETARKQCIQESHAQEFETLRGLIEARQRELRLAARELGARFYSEKPSTFSSRLGRYWRLWRRGKKDVRADALSDLPTKSSAPSS